MEAAEIRTLIRQTAPFNRADVLRGERSPLEGEVMEVEEAQSSSVEESAQHDEEAR
jgi:hypothetical protein